MADKQFSIKISQAGADQAATSIRAAADATRDLAKASTVSLGDTAAYDERMQEVAKDRVERIEKMAGRLESAGKAVRSFSSAIGESNPELGKQAELFGEVIGKAGAAASTIARGFATGGPAGAAIAAIAEGVTILTEAWINSKIEEGKAHQQLLDYEKKIADQRKETAKENAEAYSNAVVEQINKETQAIKDQNEVRDFKLGLIRETRSLEVGAATAEAELNIAKIDADDSLSPQQKIKEKLKINQDLAKTRKAEKLAQLDDKVQDAQTKADDAAGDVSEEQSKVSQTAQDIAEQIQKRTDAFNRINTIKDAQCNLPLLEKQKGEYNSSVYQPAKDTIARAHSGGVYNPFDPDIIKAQNVLNSGFFEHKQEEINKAKREVAGSLPDALKDAQQAQANIDGLAKKQLESAKQLEEAKKIADKLADEALTARQLIEGQKKVLDRTFNAEATKTSVDAARKIEDADKKDAEKAEQEKKKNAQKTQQDAQKKQRDAAKAVSDSARKAEDAKRAGTQAGDIAHKLADDPKNPFSGREREALRKTAENLQKQPKGEDFAMLEKVVGLLEHQQGIDKKTEDDKKRLHRRIDDLDRRVRADRR